MSFYETTLLKMLEPMQKGYLKLTLYNGTIKEYGDANGAFKADVHVHHANFFKRAFLYGDVGFAESFMDEEWTTTNLTQLLSWFLLNIDNTPTLSGSKVKGAALNMFQFVNKVFHKKNENSIYGSKKNISEHYDLSNEFFSLFLDKTMTYSSAYFTTQNLDLEQAQYEKYESLCQAIQLKATDHVLEIGSGWGGFAVYATKKYQCKITTITISEKQFEFAQKRFIQEGLQDKIQILLTDYRLVQGQFDKVVSIEMIEAVGAKYLKAYFNKIHSVLKPEGVFAIQAIICPDSRFELFRKNVDFIQKHIFPGSLLPSIAVINKNINETGDMFMFGLKDLGKSYVITLETWRKQFNENIEKVKALGFDDTFIRKWNYYFSYCEAAFNMRNINVVQMVYTRPNNYNF